MASPSGRPPAGALSPAPGLRFPAEFYDHQGRLALKNLTFEELEAWCASIGEAGWGGSSAGVFICL